jgi:hypothetical protein
MTALVAVSLGLSLGLCSASASGSDTRDDSGTGNATQARPAGHECQNYLDGWTEQTMQFYATGPANPYPVQEVGDALIYHDNVYDENDQEVGHAVGYVTVTSKRASDGHLISSYNHTVELPDGDLTGTGVVDRTAMFQGATAVFHVHGTSGAYAGKYGTYSWKLVQVPPDFDTRVALTLTLCG